MLNRQSVWPYVAFTGLNLGIGGLVAKGLIDDGWDPFTMSWLPFGIGGLFGLLASAVRGELRQQAWKAGSILGLLAGTFPAVLFNNGFDRLPAGVVMLLISLGPVVTAVGAHFLFDDEKFNAVKGLGLAMAVVGVGILAGGQIGGDGDGLGIVVVLIGTLFAGVSAILARVYASRHGAAPIITPQLLIGSAGGLVLWLIVGRPFSPEGGVELLHILVMVPFGISGFFGFLAMLKANELGTTGEVSVIGYLIPVVGVFGGAAVFGDAITASILVGGGLILASSGVIARGSQGRTLKPSKGAVQVR